MGIKVDHISTKQTTMLEGPKTEKVHWLKRDIIHFGKAFDDKTKAHFYTELHILLESGISLKQGLHIISKSLKKKTTKDVLFEISHQIVNGKSFSEAMQSCKHILKYEYYSIKIGEETGTLVKVIRQLAEFFERKVEYRKNIVSALTYPMIILTTALLVIFFMLKYVVPMFEEIFKQQHVELPGITVFIISCSQFITDYGWWMFGGWFVLLFSWRKLNKKPVVRRHFQKLFMQLPFAGKMLKLAYTTRFVQAMSILISARIPLLNALHLVEDMIDFYPLKDRLHDISSDIQKGEPFGQAFGRHKDFFSADLIAMVIVAEQTNATDYIFEKLSQRYADNLQRRSKTFSTLLEPLVILIVGLLVGIILISMYLPMFKLSTVIG